MTQQALNTESLKKAFQAFLKNLKKGKRTSPNPNDYGIPEATSDPFTTTTIVGPETSRGPIILVKVIRFILFMVIGTLAFANIKPYINIVAWLGSGLSDPVYEALAKFPITGWFMSLGAGTIAFLLGFLLWALLQGLEMLPKIILNDPDAILVLMSWVSNFKAVGFKEGDSALLTQLKQRFNNLPLEWIESLQTARAVAYVIDLALVLGFYPPIVGGYDRLGVFLAAPSLADIDWYNLVAALATLFAIEVLYEIGRLLNTALSLLSETNRTA